MTLGIGVLRRLPGLETTSGVWRNTRRLQLRGQRRPYTCFPFKPHLCGTVCTGAGVGEQGEKVKRGARV